MTILVALICGIIFGAGLALSGMVNPDKVQGFLDIAGKWDPSLAGVMAGAIPTAFLFFRKADRNGASKLDRPLPPPPAGKIDEKLLYGSAIFGVGWGLAGICPGPALAVWPVNGAAWVFIAAMLIGMLLEGFVASRWMKDLG